LSVSYQQLELFDGGEKNLNSIKKLKDLNHYGMFLALSS
jgi:hypothetical protein